MYHIKPLSVVPKAVDFPKCMYNIKPLNGIKFSSMNGELPPSAAPSSAKRVKMEPEFQAIQDRQLEVIAKLKSLKGTVDNLIKNAGASGWQKPKSPTRHVTFANTINYASIASSTSQLSTLTNVVIPKELVIEANPNRPPLSLIFFRHLHPTLQLVSHTHSSCKEQVNPKLLSLFTRDVDAPCSTIRIVWKNSAGIRLTPPSLGSCGVEGESNVARYLSRILSKPDSNLNLNYDGLSLDELVLVDNVLGSSDLVELAPEKFLQNLGEYIQKGGNAKARTIADYVGYSTLQYLSKTNKSQQPLQKSLIEWMNCLTNEVPSLC